MPLFVVLAPGAALDDDLTTRIRRNIRAEVSPRHVPDHIVAAPGVPVTITGKKLEVPVKRLLQGAAEATAVNRATVANPQVLDWYAGYAAQYWRRSTVGEQQGLTRGGWCFTGLRALARCATGTAALAMGSHLVFHGERCRPGECEGCGRDACRPSG
jgi:hypothetical protein